MPASAVQRLQAIDLLRIYGNIEYEWDLLTDSIKWQGPFNRLISPNISLDTGNSFAHLISVDNFESRIDTLSSALKATDPYYSSVYSLYLPEFENACVAEEGKIIIKNGVPVALHGYLRFIDPTYPIAVNMPDINFEKGYDHVTRLPGREVTFENLASVVELSYHKQIPGAYLAVSIDNLTSIGIQYGTSAMGNLFKQLLERIRPILRHTDNIGRVSSACLGLVLGECDQYGIVKVANKLINAVQKKPFYLNDKLETNISISSGAALFPTSLIETETLMLHAEKNMFEAQAIKGTGTFAPPSAPSLYVFQRSMIRGITAMKRRATDNL